MRRNSPRMLVVRAFEAAKLYAPMAVLIGPTQDRFGGWAGPAWTVFFWCCTATRLWSVVVPWWSTRYEVDAEGVRVSTGLLVRDVVSVGWNEAASVRVSRPVTHQVLKCAVVRIATGVPGKEPLTLEAVPDAVAHRVEELFTRRTGRGPGSSADDRAPGAGQRPGTTGWTGPAAAPAPRGEPVYRASALDLLLVSVTYGQFALFLPFCLGAYSELSSWVSLPVPDVVAVFDGTTPPWVLVLGFLATAVLALAYGALVAWLRYRGFTVHMRDGALHTAGGLVSRESRRVLQSQVRGLKLQQNPLMRIAGYAKLSVVSREPGGKVGGNVVFPAVQLPRLSRGLATWFPEHAGMTGSTHRALTPLDAVVPGAAVLVAAGAWWFVRTAAPDLTIPAAGALAVLALVVTDRGRTTVHLDASGSVLRFRRGVLWVTQYEFPLSAVHVSTCSSGPLSRRAGAAHLTLHVHDGRRTVLRVLACPAATASRLTRALERGRTPDPAGTPATTRATASTAV